MLLAALLLDLLLGDPPNRWHPVAWMGTLIARLRQAAPKRGKFAYGGLITFGGALLVWGLAVLVVRVSGQLPAPLATLAQAWLLKTAFSMCGLNSAAYDVETALHAHDIPEARRLLSWHLVSRDTSALNTAQIAAAAIESVAENTSDGIIAPLFWYRIGGLPAALAYRYVQTCDSMLGYRDAEREWLGKIPARTDDALNLIPARATALLFVATSANRRRAWHIWQRDANKTASPNAGHPMSAAAGALGVELEKVGHYKLGAGQRHPTPHDIRPARRLMVAAATLFTGLLCLSAVVRTYAKMITRQSQRDKTPHAN